MPNDLEWIHSNQLLRKSRGNIGPAFSFVQMGLPALDLTVWDDDFLGDIIRGDATSPGIYEVVTGVDGAIAILANQTNGVAEIRASDGAGGGDEYCGLSLPELSYLGDNYCGIAARIAIDAITSVKVEVGFNDVTTDAGMVDVLATPTKTGGAGDGCVWIIDTSDTGNSGNWQGVGFKANTPPTKVEPSMAPTAGTFEWMIVILEGDNAKFIRLDQHANKTFESAWMDDAIEGGTKICPWVFVQERSGNDRNVQLDRLIVWGNRTTG